MSLSLFFLLVAYNLSSVEAQMQVFIGQGSKSLYFALRTTNYEWDWGLNYCHNYRLMPGSIETEEDHKLITNFLNTSTEIEDENRFLWLAATDHRREGTFQWMWNMENVTVGLWAPGMPSTNRTANCLAINREGHFMEESCFESGRHYHTLCEAPNFSHGNRHVSYIKINVYDKNDAKTESKIAYQTSPTFTVIGQVGNKIYFTDSRQISWTESLDLCHFAGMRLATPEKSEQLDFIMEYASQQGAIYYLGGTDRLSVSCLRTNSEFRWFYSGKPIANQTNLVGGSWWYMCTYVSPQSGLYATGCAKGGGVFARPICEITVQT